MPPATTTTTRGDNEGGHWPAIEVKGANGLDLDLLFAEDKLQEIWLKRPGLATGQGIRVGDLLKSVVSLGKKLGCTQSAEGGDYKTTYASSSSTQTSLNDQVSAERRDRLSIRCR